jgi:hypothetical protein
LAKKLFHQGLVPLYPSTRQSPFAARASRTSREKELLFRLRDIGSATGLGQRSAFFLDEPISALANGSREAR